MKVAALLTLAVALLSAAGFAAAGCATFTAPVAAASACGNPCAATSCPSAFTCQVDTHCVARCQAEPAKPGQL